MPELREVFEMATKQIEPDVHEWERQQQRQRRRTRNRRLGTYALVAALVIGAAVIAVRVLPDRTEEPVPMTPPERPESGVALVDLDGTIVGMIGTDGTPEMRTLMIASSSYGLTLSPDANRAVVSDGTEIFTMNVDGTDLTKVTDGVNPAWSPDGSSIAFADSEGIHVIAPEGAGRRQIVSARVPLAAWPVWSPDGRRITYMIEGQTSSEHGIYVVDAEGGADPAHEEMGRVPLLEPGRDDDRVHAHRREPGPVFGCRRRERSSQTAHHRSRRTGCRDVVALRRPARLLGLRRIVRERRR